MNAARMATAHALVAKLVALNQLEILEAILLSHSVNDFVLFVSESYTVDKVSVTAACAISIMSGSITRFFRARRKTRSMNDCFLSEDPSPKWFRNLWRWNSADGFQRLDGVMENSGGFDSHSSPNGSSRAPRAFGVFSSWRLPGATPSNVSQPNGEMKI